MSYRTSVVWRTTAVAALVIFAACHDATPTAPSGDAGVPTTPQAARSPVAQARLEAIFERTWPEVMALPGAVFADNDEVAGRLVFGVENAAAAQGMRQALTRLGVADGDFAVEVTQPIHQMKTLRDVFAPTQAGIQINFTQWVCTLGFNIEGGTKGTQTYGRSFITNSHCTSTQGGTEGTNYYQPSSSTSDIIATEADDPVYVKAGCPRGKKCRYSDASRALYAVGRGSNSGEIAQTTGVNNGSLTVSTSNPLFSITGVDDDGVAVNTVVNKVGRTTGWTQGRVTRTCVNTAVQGSQVLQLCQTWVNNSNATIVAGGDSGSPVFTGTGNVTLVGILWGGSSDNKTFIFSPYGQIQDELGTFTGVTK